MPTFSRGSPSVADLTPKFVRYIEVELCFARSSVIKYEDCLRQIIKMIGDRPVISYTADDILDLKSAMLRKNHSTARQVSILSALKRFLEFCSKHEGLSVIDPNHILVPKRPRREVAYLTVEEVERFVGAIRLTNLRDKISVSGLRFRTWSKCCWGAPCALGTCCRSIERILTSKIVKRGSSANAISSEQCFSPNAPWVGFGGILIGRLTRTRRFLFVKMAYRDANNLIYGGRSPTSFASGCSRRYRGRGIARFLSSTDIFERISRCSSGLYAFQCDRFM